MNTELQLASDILEQIPAMIGAGIAVISIINSIREVLDANSAPGDELWDRLDKTVNDLKSQLAIDPPDNT